MTQQEFSNKIGISPASLSSIFTGRTRPTNNHVQAIHEAFPEISVNWLMFGEGDMLGAIPSPPETGATENSDAPNLFSSPRVSEKETQEEAILLPDLSGIARQIEDLRSEVKEFDKSLRRIKEIRVFYDDGTYESFSPGRY